MTHFLQQHFGPRVQIDVFEKGTVGGRLATISVNKQHYESGAASFHSLSLHMQEFIKHLGECDVLRLHRPASRADSSHQALPRLPLWSRP